MYSKKLFSKSHYYVGTEAYLPVHLEQGAIYIAIDTRTTWCYDLEQNPQQINPAAVLTPEQQTTLEHFRYNPETDKLEGDRSIETLLSSLYLGTAWKISSAGDSITFVTEEFNESYFPVTYGFKDHENPAYQGPDGYITAKVSEVGDLQNIEIFGPAAAPGISTNYQTSGTTTDDVFIFSIEVIIEQEILSSDIILYEFFGGPDFSYPLIYEQRLTDLSLHPGDVLHMQFSNPLKQVAGSNVSTRLTYAQNDEVIVLGRNGGPQLEFIQVRAIASDPNHHYSRVQLRFYNEKPIATQEYVTDLFGSTQIDIDNIFLALDDKVDDYQVMTDVPASALFTDTIYNDTFISERITQVETDLDGKVDNSRVLTDVPLGAVFTDTVYDDTVLEARVSQNELDIDLKLESVSSDSTLTGDGTILNPLSVVSMAPVVYGVYAVHSDNIAVTPLTQNIWSQIIIAPSPSILDGFSHDGAGTFTYTGLIPKKFIIEATISQIGKGDDKMCYFAWYVNGIQKPGIMAQDMHKTKYYGDVNPKCAVTLYPGDTCNVWMVNVENSDDTTIKYINITIHEF